MDTIDKLKKEWNDLTNQIRKLEEQRSKKITEFQDEKMRIMKSLPDLFGVVTKNYTINGFKLNVGEVYSLDYDDDCEPVFTIHQRNYSENDTKFTYCPTCCKMKIHTREELTMSQRENINYAAYR